MKAFQFSLQAVLRLRELATEKALQTWAEAIQELNKNNRDMEFLKNRISQWQTQQRAKQGELLTAGEWSRLQLNTEDLYQRLLIHQRLHARLLNRVQETLKLWDEARRREEIFVRLKKRSHQTWEQEWEREEQKILDERATLQSGRNSIRNLELEPQTT